MLESKALGSGGSGPKAGPIWSNVLNVCRK